MKELSALYHVPDIYGELPITCVSTRFPASSVVCETFEQFFFSYQISFTLCLSSLHFDASSKPYKPPAPNHE